MMKVSMPSLSSRYKRRDSILYMRESREETLGRRRVAPRRVNLENEMSLTNKISKGRRKGRRRRVEM